jgi:hypothetical protein
MQYTVYSSSPALDIVGDSRETRDALTAVITVLYCWPGVLLSHTAGTSLGNQGPNLARTMSSRAVIKRHLGRDSPDPCPGVPLST